MVKECAQDKLINLPISGIGGIETWRDAVEYILLGSANVQVCAAVMHYGFGIIREMISGLEQYMADKKFNTIQEMIGLALPNVKSWENLNLSYKVIAEINDEKCIGCELCYIACEDGAHQAIGLNKGSRTPFIIDENCVGCNLCALVCPVEECITMVPIDTGKDAVTWKERTDRDDIPKTFNDVLAGGIGHFVPKPSDALKNK